MKALFPAIVLLLAGASARATLAELGAVEPVAAPAVSFQSSPANRPDAEKSAVDLGFMPLEILMAGEAFATQPLAAIQAKDQSGLLLSKLPRGLATRLYCASMDPGFAYVNPLVWTKASSPAWTLAFSYYSLTSHEEPLLDLNLPHKTDFLSPSLLEPAPDLGAPHVDD